MKRYFSTFFAFFCFACLVLCIGSDAMLCTVPDTVYGKVLRLHVLANSDSEQDQELKLKVRDGMLEVTKVLFYDCINVEQALGVAKENASLLEDTAKRVIEENGSSDNVKIVIGKENYPEKTYEGYTFPEGEYLSVRVLIGNGTGQNWWCVLFPPLCNAGIEEAAEVLESRGLSKEEIDRLKKKNEKGGIEIFGCRVKLKIMDLFG